MDLLFLWHNIECMKKNILPFFLLLLPGISLAQQTAKVDFITADSDIRFDISERKVIGNVTYDFTVLTEIDTIRIDAKNMVIDKVLLNGKTVDFKNDKKQLKLYKGYVKGKNSLAVSYKTVPKQALYFAGNGLDLQVWTQGQGKYTSHWLPSFDDENEKVIFNTKVTFENGYQVVSNGILDKKVSSGTTTTWSYKMNHPMSSYLAMIAIGKYQVSTEKGADNTTIESYLRPVDTSKSETTYKHTKKIFDFLSKETGFNYPWKIYRNIPVEDFLYSGMENTTSTIFNQDFVVDAIGVNDRDYVNVNAHEMAHQWFGNVVTAKTRADHWLQEGFATYYALLAEQYLFGNDYFYWELYEMAEKIQKESTTANNTMVVSEGATTLTYYQKGAWMLFVLKSQIGDDNFNTAVKNYLEKYAYKNVTTAQFLEEVQTVANGFNREKFEKEWLYNNKFPIKEALKLLSNSPFITNYLELIEKQNIPFSNKKDALLTLLKGDYPEQIKKEVVYQLHKVPYAEAKEFYQWIATSKDLKVRQALVQIIQEIPAEFRESYKGFLEDPSYVTREIALKNLWYQLPDYRQALLDKTKTWVGFNDKNLRITWLMLALGTDNYNKEKKPHWYSELSDYATSKYNSNIRQNAIQAMWFLNPYDSNVLPQLVNALVHHKWQFQKLGKDGIRNLYERKEFKEYFDKLIPYLPDDEHEALKALLSDDKK